MNYNYDYNQGETKKKKTLLVSIVIALVVLLVANVIVLSIITTALKNQVNDNLGTSLTEMESQLDDRIDTAIADRLTTTISDEVKTNLTSEVVSAATSLVSDTITEEVLTQYKKEYNLPEDYAGIGVIVAEEIDSVMELTTSANLNEPYQTQTTSSQSSAIVLTAGGYLLTNAHCVTFEDNIYEYVNNGFWGSGYRITGTETRIFTTIQGNFKGSTTMYDMEVIAYDADKDLAIIKMINPPANLQPVTIGDSELLNIGEETAVIGNAQGLGISITTGVVSDTSEQYYDVKIIQTDATINPGNSGGPLFNIYGEFIGVVSFKIIESEVNEGLGFAIASNSVVEYIQSVQTEKSIQINYTLSTR